MKIINVLVAFALCAVTVHKANAVLYNDQASDSTLRIDYILGGTASAPTIALSKASKSEGWHGRRSHLDELPYTAHGQMTMTSAATGDTLYRTSFSSLYLEWLEMRDSVARAFEHTILAPLPAEDARVTLELFDNRGKNMTKHTFLYRPTDILVRPLEKSPYTTHTLHSGDYNGHRINVAILPEGYTADEMDTFLDDATKATEQILAHEPFKTFADRFNFTAVIIPGQDSGVSVPRLGQWKDTAFGSHFSTFDSDRYLTTPNVFDIHDALAGLPYEHIIILANTDEYGGGGIYNSYTLTTAHHADFFPVVVHEFGHSFGGLADEYYYENDVMSDTYPTDTEPWEPNVTTLVDFDSKWKSMLMPDTPVPTPADNANKYVAGVYEGAAYSFQGIYRSALDCRMKTNTAKSFCPACIRALTRLILFYTE